MITRPLDLASKLRPEPRSFDWLFLVNGGLIVLFFTLHGSQYVLTPGVEFKLPVAEGANAAAQPSTHRLTVTATGMILVREGLLPMENLRQWLNDQAKTDARPTLRIQADASVQVSMLTTIDSTARAAGFVAVHLAVVEPPAPAKGGGR